MAAGVPITTLAVPQLMDALFCGAVLVDELGAIVHVNERFAALTGRTRAELLGMPLGALCDRVAVPRPGQTTAGSDPPSGGTNPGTSCASLATPDAGLEAEFALRRPDGTHVPVIASGRRPGAHPPLDAYRLVTVIDISAQKAAEAREHEQYVEICELSDTILQQALDLKRHSTSLEEKVRERTRELREANMDAITMLAVASESRDGDTGAHVHRIRNYVTLLARELGLEPELGERLGHSAILHDVGKIVVRDAILKKPGPLTAAERAEMETHTVAGERILADRPFFETARAIARHHHENWDGSGYPDRLAGTAIPLAARITHVADVFDALASPRVYKDAWPPARAIAAVRAGAGRLFDPEVITAFDRLVAAGAIPNGAGSR